MAERTPPPTPHWEDHFEPKTELGRMLIESPRRRRAAGERFLTDDEIDGLLGRGEDVAR